MQQVIQPFTIGILSTTLNAAQLTGSAASNDLVANFSAGIDTLFPSPTAPIPVLKTDSATLGTQFSINVEGVWVAQAIVGVTAITTVIVSIGLDLQSTELNSDGPQNSRVLAQAVAIALAGGSVPVVLTTTPFVVTREMAASPSLGLIRLKLSAGTGAPPLAAGILTGGASVRITRVGGLPGVGA